MNDIKEAVRQKYGQAAVRAGSCCGASASKGTDPITSEIPIKRPADSPKLLFSLLSAAVTPPGWPN
jgi:hypothetical protein